jgi:DNA-binding beta-propeller fold protein YncE
MRPPAGPGLEPHGGRVVATVAKLDPTTGATVDTYPIVGAHTGIAFDGTDIWVANFNNSDPDGTVTQLAASNGTIVGTYTVGTLPRGVLFDPVHHTIWVADSDNSTVTSVSD